jgi:DNA primase
MNRKLNYYRLFGDYLEGLTLTRYQSLVKCIFHTDKNASLSVNTEKGIFNCFSCGTKGNHWDFLKFVEPEANIKKLMEKYYE